MTAWMLIANWRHTRRRMQAQHALVAETMTELQAVVDGDVDGIWGAHRSLNQAIGLILHNRWVA